MEIMNEQERKLLGSLIGEEPDDSGSLYAYQAEALRQLRQLLRYMENKYPQTAVEYRYFEPITKISERAVLICCVKGSGDLRRAIIRRSAEGDVCMDDLYVDLVRERYDEALRETLSDVKGLKKVYTDFVSMCGEGIDADSTAEQINSFRPRIRRHTDLFVCGARKLSAKQKHLLEEKGFSGTFTVYEVPENWECPDPVMDLYDDLEAGEYFGISKNNAERRDDV